MVKRTRVLWADIREICAEHGVLIRQEPVTRTMSLYVSDGRWRWVVNPMTGARITRLSDFSVEEWKGIIARLLIDLTGE